MAKSNAVAPMHAIAAERVETKVFKYVSENRVRVPPEAIVGGTFPIPAPEGTGRDS